MRVVLDCNVLISAGLTDGACRQVLDEVIRRHDWFYSPPLLAELRAVTAYPRLAKYRHKLEQIATVMVAIGHEVAPAPDLITLPDPVSILLLSISTLGTPPQDAIASCPLAELEDDRHGPNAFPPRPMRRGIVWLLRYARKWLLVTPDRY